MCIYYCNVVTYGYRRRRPWPPGYLYIIVVRVVSYTRSWRRTGLMYVHTTVRLGVCMCVWVCECLFVRYTEGCRKTNTVRRGTSDGIIVGNYTRIFTTCACTYVVRAYRGCFVKLISSGVVAAACNDRGGERYTHADAVSGSRKNALKL